MLFELGTGTERKRRFTSYSPLGSRSTDASLAELTERQLQDLLRQSQPAWTSPEGGYDTAHSKQSASWTRPQGLSAPDRPVVGRFVAEGRFVVAGLPIAARVFQELEPDACLEPLTAEGGSTEPGATLATVRGAARALLAGERVALNFLQRLSGIAP